MQISFPQKSIFTILRATKLICPTIEDATGIILGSDGLQHINALARIDCNVQHPSGDMRTTSPAAGRLLSGGAVQNNGSVQSVANETLRFVLSDAYPTMRYGAGAKTQTLTIYYQTSVVGAYITATRIYAWTNDGSQFELLNDPTDRGNGLTGYDNYVAAALDDGLSSTQILEIDTIVPTGLIEIVYWELTYSDS